ncbi:MAG: hypothetical protein ACO3WI_10700 [Ilumatobacteraceae bacterium]
MSQFGRDVDTSDLRTDGRAESLHVEVLPVEGGEPSPLLGEMGDGSDRLAVQLNPISTHVDAGVLGGDDVGMCSAGHVPSGHF